jgi:peptidoglycan lytic transglycosylase G
MKFIVRLFLLLVLAGIAVGGYGWWWLQQPLPLAADVVEVSIETGTPPRDVARAWVQAGVDVPPALLFEYFRWSGQARKMRAGTYEIERGATPRVLLDKMVRGDEVMASMRLIEGWTFRQFRAELARTPELKQNTARMTDAQVMSTIGFPGVAPEGRFFPDTYAFSKGASDTAVLRRAYLAMQKQVEQAWAQRAPDTPLKTPDELLNLASIVEKETGAAGDRGKVAAVFVNRLRIGMPLQTDPTIIYGLGEKFDGNLRKIHLQTDGPYNTYLRGGLPPTPISMPGKAALLATVKPDATKAIFFVSRGDGSSHFSETLAEHNRAVNQYQK